MQPSLFNGGEQGRRLKRIDRCDIERRILTGGKRIRWFLLSAAWLSPLFRSSSEFNFGSSSSPVEKSFTVEKSTIRTKLENWRIDGQLSAMERAIARGIFQRNRERFRFRFRFRARRSQAAMNKKFFLPRIGSWIVEKASAFDCFTIIARELGQPVSMQFIRCVVVLFSSS